MGRRGILSLAAGPRTCSFGGVGKEGLCRDPQRQAQEGKLRLSGQCDAALGGTPSLILTLKCVFSALLRWTEGSPIGHTLQLPALSLGR